MQGSPWEEETVLGKRVGSRGEGMGDGNMKDQDGPVEGRKERESNERCSWVGGHYGVGEKPGTRNSQESRKMTPAKTTSSSTEGVFTGLPF